MTVNARKGWDSGLLGVHFLEPGGVRDELFPRVMPGRCRGHAGVMLLPLGRVPLLVPTQAFVVNAQSLPSLLTLLLIPSLTPSLSLQRVRNPVPMVGL